MYFNPVDKNEAAGFFLYKDETHQYFLAVPKAKDRRRISLSMFKKDEYQVHSVKPINNESSAINLKVESQGTHYNFYYSIVNSEWELLFDYKKLV